MPEPTFWNGEPCHARKVRVVIGNHGNFDHPWFLPFVGHERDAVEITYDNRTFYIDDSNGTGWHKVTLGKGSPRWGHSSLDVDQVLT
jgi:hypothetical protein